MSFLFSFSFLFIDLYFLFCFSCSGWGIGPCGGVIEPDLVAKMRSDEGSCDNFFFGPSVMVPYREPFAYERYMFGDSQYHACGKYAALEKKFFSENEEIMREIFFDTNNLLGVDSDDDVDEVVPVNYHDLVPEMFSEEGQLRRDRVKEVWRRKLCGCLLSIRMVKMEELWSGWRPPWSWRLLVIWWMPVWLLALLT